MTRLPILESTVKQLYGTATTCAHPECDEKLLRWVDALRTPVLNSRIAHICAASALGPRYDQAMTDEDRRAFGNLILLCLPHAEEVDLKALAAVYPVETLRRWKAVQLQAPPAKSPELPEGLLERAVLLSMGDVLMDFRDATIDLGGKAALAPGAGGSGGGAIGPGARGGDGGPGGGHHTFAVTGLQVLGEVPIEIGQGGRFGVDGLPGEAGGHTRFGAVITPGGGRDTHSPFPEALAEIVTTSVSSALFANYAEMNNGLSYLIGAGWSSYEVVELPGPFRAALWVWVDVSWTDIEPGTEIPIELIVELITPSKTATFSKKAATIVAPPERDGFDRATFGFSVVGTLHDAGLHVLDLSCNTGARLGQYLKVVTKPSPEGPTT
ncbi:hypothetical protein [Streptomyces sp. SID13031]|uniref:hypothetical protein n=1 Tax=Streptomyces sp. SID13031 TaxID=2706046 RepID=UPI0013CCE2EC|nr:hypothetical protein [Streptomyces sp. SID13031]NEA36078.1 hypothetical protein [Streptomyces sp. SID13031]